jgi:hypothetical protein
MSPPLMASGWATNGPESFFGICRRLSAHSSHPDLILKGFLLSGIITATSTCGDIFMPRSSQSRTASPSAWRRSMRRSIIDFDIVRKIGLALPDVEESTAYGSPALKVHGKLLACVPANRSAEPGSLVIRVDLDARAELLAADPNVYYVTKHYVSYDAVLVRLSRVNPDVLRDLLGMAHKFVTRNAALRSPARK